MKISDLFLILAAFCIGTVAAASCASAPRQSDPYPAELIGAEDWRVLGTEAVTDPLQLMVLRANYADVERCLGTTKDATDLTYYRTIGLFLRIGPDEWTMAYGVTFRERDAIYLGRNIMDSNTRALRGVTPAEFRTTMRHEQIHYITGLSHQLCHRRACTPEQHRADDALDRLMARCTYTGWRS